MRRWDSESIIPNSPSAMHSSMEPLQGEGEGEGEGTHLRWTFSPIAPSVEGKMDMGTMKNKYKDRRKEALLDIVVCGGGGCGGGALILL